MGSKAVRSNRHHLGCLDCCRSHCPSVPDCKYEQYDCTPSQYSKAFTWLIADVTELVMTLMFDVEIIIRFIVSFPDWRNFFRKSRNLCDLFLAVSTSIIQIPPIHNATAYGWLTIFQILRVYRVILAIPMTRNLLVISRSLLFLTL